MEGFPMRRNCCTLKILPVLVDNQCVVVPVVSRNSTLEEAHSSCCCGGHLSEKKVYRHLRQSMFGGEEWKLMLGRSVEVPTLKGQRKTFRQSCGEHSTTSVNCQWQEVCHCTHGLPDQVGGIVCDPRPIRKRKQLPNCW